ncbi:DUF3618 domain-containing protein [Jannaschia ovalis]|uniref:DUF3618 domain-containing protein n=1 Tax=Jannaschia ovalis TaxID=3038773 RepID=A0ABY8LGJ6_9RHOB|nr:DUF3618 domain-containing protein [Jannaschia sp. GRR-S6-38]WGH79470.1 DUF3618 domain-containing protein [Jannaschia sp. GRR-S6-38]
MAETKSVADIEREIEAERGALARSLEDLQARFAPEQIADTAKDYLRENGGQIAAKAGNTLKENPVGAILTGVGVAMMIAGRSRKKPGYDRWAATHDEHAPDWGRKRGAADAAGTPPQPAWDRSAKPAAPGLRQEAPPMAGFDARLARAEGDAEEPSRWDAAAAQARALRDKAAAALHGLEEKVRGSEDPGRSRDAFLRGAREGYAAASAREARLKAPDIPSRGRYRASAELRNRITEGTEDMSDDARDRVIRARQKAHDAQAAVEERLGDYAARGRRGYDAQPLIGGLLAFGLGAAIGAALPRTRREDEMLGEYRDRAFEEADRIFRTEAAKLQAVAEAALNEARDVADEAMRDAKRQTPTGREAVDRVEETAEAAAERIKSAAEDEAEKQKLGSSLN